MSNQFSDVSEVLNRLVPEAVACTPAEWTKGVLTIVCDGVRIDYSLKNDSEPGTASISEKLRTLIDEFYIRSAQSGQPWLEAQVTFTISGNDVGFKTSFKYSSPPIAKASETTKPLWKLWA